MGIRSSKIRPSSSQRCYRFKPYRFERVRSLEAVTEDEQPPSILCYTKVACNEKEAFVYGGQESYLTSVVYLSGNCEREVELQVFKYVMWKFNLESRTWKKLRMCQRSSPRLFLDMHVALNGKVLVVFGVTWEATAHMYSLHVYDLESDGLLTDPKIYLFAEPRPSHGQAVLVCGPELYVVEGRKSCPNVHRLNLRTKLWEKLCSGEKAVGEEDEPMCFYQALCFELDRQRLYVVSREAGESGLNFDQLKVFEVESRTWRVITTSPDADRGFPTHRVHPSCCRIEGSDILVLYGGSLFGVSLDDVWRLSLSSFQWTNIEYTRLLLPLSFQTSGISPAGKVVTYGGIFGNKSGKRLKTVDVTTAWLCIPKLKEICWEAVKYYGLLSGLNKEKIVSTGIPPEFLQRQ